ncbi:retrovirus-related pol polyprotein from transposon TNT 1-94 [Tanacetum coccineum]
MNSPEPTLSSRPTKVEVPKELPKVSMVNTSLKKLKYHLAGFDVVVKERTIPTAITEGSWGFEHTKACFRDEIIPFVKALKDLFNTFDQYLIDELSKVQNVFHQMEQAVEQHHLESKTFEEKVLAITALKDDLRKLKGKALVDNNVTKQPSDPEMLRIDEEATVLRDLVEHVKSKYPLDKSLESCHCNGCMLSDNHDLCVLDFINNVNARTKSKPVKKNSKRKVWKPTRKVFTNIVYIWRHTGQNFTIVGNMCPLTRITTTTEVPFRKPTALDNETSKPVVTLVYSQNPRKSKTNVPVSKSKNLGKLQPKADIGIFIGYAPTKKAFRIYNRRTRRIIKTIHVDFDELTVMASEHSNLGPALHEMTPTTISSGLMPNPPPLIPFIPPSRTDLDLLFQPLFDELLTPPPSVDCPAPEVIAPIAKVVAPEPAVSTGSPSLTTVNQDAPSPSNSQTTPETQSSIIPNDVEEYYHDLDVAHMNNDPFFGITIPENDSKASSSDVIPTVVQTTAPYSEHVTKWTKDHPLDNIIGELERPVYTRLQLHEQALFCNLHAFLSSELVPHLEKEMVITLKWIYKVKLNELGGILKNKAHLVSRGYRQEEGIDFEKILCSSG